MVKLLSSQNDKLLALIGVMLFFIDQRTIIFSMLIFIYFTKFDVKQAKELYTIKKIINCIVYFIFSMLFIYVISIASKYTLQEFDEQQIVQYFKQNEVTKLDIINTIIIVPIIEEIVFRGLFYKLLKSYFSILTSMVISSIIFSVVHETILASVVLFSVGLISCLSYERYRSIIYPIIIHSLFNLFMLLLIVYV